MTTVSRKYKAKQKLARKRLSKKRSNNKKNGGAGADYSPEATTDGDKRAEEYLTQKMAIASENGKNYENNKPGYDKYWLEEIIPSMRDYLQKQKDKNEITNPYYKAASSSINQFADSISNS